MKKILLPFSLLLAISSQAQSGQFTKAANKNVGLVKGQEITISSETTQQTDLSMGMTIESDSKTTTKVKVENADDKTFTLSSVLKKMTVNSNAMGQSINYDSDKKEDRESEFGKTVSAALDKVNTIVIDRVNGNNLTVKNAEDKDKEDNDPLGGLASSFVDNDPNAAVTGIVFFVPANQKAGYQWTDSSKKDGLTKIDNYTIESVNGNLVTLNTTGSLAGTSSMDMQGQAFDMTINTKTKGSFTVDTKTNLVKNRTNTADMDGSIDMAGQSMTFTGKANTKIKYE
jgi:hypothetical protein